MPRRQRKDVEPGQLYAVEWPEWHVQCRQKGCDETYLTAETGVAMTLREAERVMRDRASKDGWDYRKGFWYCPAHAS